MQCGRARMFRRRPHQPVAFNLPPPAVLAKICSRRDGSRSIMVCLPRVCTMTSLNHSDTTRDSTRCLSTYEPVSSHYDHGVPKIDPTGPVPPYLQVAEIIRNQIRSGKLPTGS